MNGELDTNDASSLPVCSAKNTRAKVSENGEQRLLFPLEMACSFSLVMRRVSYLRTQSLSIAVVAFFRWQHASSMRYQRFIFE